MIEKIWFEKHLLGWLLWPLFWPLSKLFKCLAERRRGSYQKDDKRVYRAPVPVIVVGNITVGGNGKTPTVIWLVELLQRYGFKPGVVSRGYGAKAPSYPLVLDSGTSTKHCGDEPKLIHQRTGVPVAVSPVRSEAVKALLPAGVDIIVTDDGLQHYALARDIEIVVVDGNRRFGNEKLLPLGPLRESVERLNSVDFVITNGGKASSEEVAMSLTPSLAVNLITSEQAPVSQLNELVAFAGIAHPPRFFATLKELGASIKLSKSFADHKDFDPTELASIANQGDNVIMTEKDAVKCQQYAQDNWWYLPVSASIAEHDEQKILDRIKEVMRSYGSSTT
ncbi:tetraacyldisaccharide 4'-kinase [Vibrio sp. S4M6]|uniref:tetraacyldisaccharide 4'-kinase n=1 Tax=Vibrio sinus TaxID=2946865 RepID=UPI002029D717|nr:tetraacyldisaccharide 4'-kinase [Vibrio sinus]